MGDEVNVSISERERKIFARGVARRGGGRRKEGRWRKRRHGPF